MTDRGWQLVAGGGIGLLDYLLFPLPESLLVTIVAAFLIGLLIGGGRD